MTRDEIIHAALDELEREGFVERLPGGKLRITEQGLADGLARAAADPALARALNDELAKLGVPPIVPGSETPS